MSVSSSTTGGSVGVASLLAVELVLLVLALALAFTPAEVLPVSAGRLIDDRRPMLVATVGAVFGAVFLGLGVSLLLS